jgi:ubiquinone/menaquinone biosynthesis C-methylase UbiE
MPGPSKMPHSIAETSTGHVKSSAAWLDLHFKAAQAGYLEMLGSVGIQPSWYVLDAGCGSGSFLPFIADLVGPSGKIYAVDVAKEHIANVEKSVEAGSFLCPVQVEVSSITSLPYADNTFDAVWCANVSQYLTDTELSASLEGFRRVAKSGGLIAIKEFDGRAMTFYPGNPLIFGRFMLTRYPITSSIQGHYRAISTKFRMEELGLINVRQRTTVIEHSQPLGLIERAFLADLFIGWSAIAHELDLPGEDMQFWQEQEDPDAPTHIINQPDFFWREGAILAVGQVP